MTDAPIDQLKAEHGVLIAMGVPGMPGTVMYARLPKLEELTAVSAATGLADKAVKKLAFQCIVWPVGSEQRAIFAAKPGAITSLGLKLVEASGKTGPVVALEEYELTDELADVMVKWAENRPHALTYEREETGARFTLVCREPNAAELDLLIKHQGDAAKMRDLVRTLTVWPTAPDESGKQFLDTAPIEERAPGLFSMIAGVLAQAAGLTANIEVGKV